MHSDAANGVDSVALARLYGEPLFAMPRDLYIPPDALEIFLETFQGPLDLLLYLIRKQNFNVLDIPMAEVTRQYLSYVDQIRDQNLELAGEYLLMAALLILAPILLPEFKDPNGGKLDILSAALSLFAILSVIYGIKGMAQDGLGANSILSICIGLVLGTVFVSRQKRLTHPLIDLELFKVPAFSAAVGTQLAATITFGGLYLLVSQYLQLVVSLSPLHAGMTLLPATVAGTIGTIAAPLLVRRIAVGYVMPAGMILSSVGMVLIALMNASSGVGLLVAAYIVMSFGVNIAMTLTTDTIMTVAPPERAGAASGISETAAELGAALGIALLGSVSTAYYRSAMGIGMPSVIPTGVAVDARATIGGAIVSAAKLGGNGGAQLAEVARESFTASLSIVALISAVLVLITSLVTIGILKRNYGSAVETVRLS